MNLTKSSRNTIVRGLCKKNKVDIVQERQGESFLKKFMI